MALSWGRPGLWASCWLRASKCVCVCVLLALRHANQASPERLEITIKLAFELASQRASLSRGIVRMFNSLLQVHHNVCLVCMARQAASEPT